MFGPSFTCNLIMCSLNFYHMKFSQCTVLAQEQFYLSPLALPNLWLLPVFSTAGSRVFPASPASTLHRAVNLPRLQILRIDRQGMIDDVISHGVWHHLGKKYLWHNISIISGRFHTLIWRRGDTVQNLECPGLSGRVDSTAVLLSSSPHWRKILK